MKFYYNNIGYTCKWKSLARDNMWYIMQPAKIRIHNMPRKFYDDILKNTDEILLFKLLMLKSENKINQVPDFFNIKARIDSIIITSSTKTGLVDFAMHLSLIDIENADISELRELLLEEIL